MTIKIIFPLKITIKVFIHSIQKKMINLLKGFLRWINILNLNQPNIDILILNLYFYLKISKIILIFTPKKKWKLHLIHIVNLENFHISLKIHKSCKVCSKIFHNLDLACQYQQEDRAFKEILQHIQIWCIIPLFPKLINIEQSPANTIIGKI